MNAYSGAVWGHVFDSGYIADEMTLSHIFVIILISYPIYGLMIWYFSEVIPFKHSIVKPFYFPLKYIYEKYLKKFHKNSSNNYQSMDENLETNAIIIKGLNKKYISIFGLKSDHILHDIDLNVNNNSITVILGPNGSGKTTLLSLILGDNPQAYMNDVAVFGKKRGGGESIWEIKKHIGWVSPELHVHFDDSATCLEVVESGFYDSVGLFDTVTPRQRAAARLWLEELDSTFILARCP